MPARAEQTEMGTSGTGQKVFGPGIPIRKLMSLAWIGWPWKGAFGLIAVRVNVPSAGGRMARALSVHLVE